MSCMQLAMTRRACERIKAQTKQQNNVDNLIKDDERLVTEFIAVYNAIHNAGFAIESWPEKEQRNQPAVEVIARDGNKIMAIEHTTIRGRTRRQCSVSIGNRTIGD
jgi:hypothetical protein